MEKKPIKRNEHIVKLSKDHHFTLLFCWKIRNGIKYGVDTVRMQNYVEYFWQHHMHPHFRQEETILFAPVQNDVVQRAQQEHRQIESQISSIDAATHNAADQLSVLCDIVDNHVRYEERELFPFLENILTEEQLVKIGEEIARQHNPLLKDDFADEFWVKKGNGQ